MSAGAQAFGTQNGTIWDAGVTGLRVRWKLGPGGLLERRQDLDRKGRERGRGAA